MAEEFKQGSHLIGVDAIAPAALGRDSIQITRDAILQWRLEGRVSYAQQGDAGTKLSFGETAYDEDQPQFALTVPAGAILIPLAMNILIEDITGTENHIIWSTTTNDIGAGTSTPLAPVNARRDNLYATAVKAYSLYTGNATAATGLFEVRRWYHPFASAAVTDGVDLHHHRWTLDDPDMPILLGPATLQMHCYGGSALQGFGEYKWISIDAAALGL